MQEKDFFFLKLQPGDRINVWVWFRKKPFTGTFVTVQAQSVFWETEHSKHSRTFSELLKVEKLD
jgi:hypothetical protein